VFGKHALNQKLKDLKNTLSHIWQTRLKNKKKVFFLGKYGHAKDTLMVKIDSV
jgi:hypothetical protein